MSFGTKPEDLAISNQQRALIEGHHHLNSLPGEFPVAGHRLPESPIAI